MTIPQVNTSIISLIVYYMIEIIKRGIGIKSKKYANKRKYGNKLKMELSDHRTKA